MLMGLFKDNNLKYASKADLLNGILLPKGCGMRRAWCVTKCSTETPEQPEQVTDKNYKADSPTFTTKNLELRTVHFLPIFHPH
jgi:hypothetical protein